MINSAIHQHYHCKCFEWAIKFFPYWLGEIEWLWNFVRQVCAEWNDKAILIAQNNLLVSVVPSEQLPCRYLAYTSRIIGSNLIEARESSTHVFHLLSWFGRWRRSTVSRPSAKLYIASHHQSWPGLLLSLAATAIVACLRRIETMAMWMRSICFLKTNQENPNGRDRSSISSLRKEGRKDGKV